MPIDSIIFKAVQGDEEDLEQRILQFINQGPVKDVVTITSWTIGITVYIMILYRLGDIIQTSTETVNPDIYTKALGPKTTYEY